MSLVALKAPLLAPAQAAGVPEQINGTRLFKSKDLVLIAIYESSSENTLKYLGGQTVYPIMIADPELKIYDLYDIEYSLFKLMKGLFNGALENRTAPNFRELYLQTPSFPSRITQELHFSEG